MILSPKNDKIIEMFTGIIEEVGTVSLVVRKGNSSYVSITLKKALSDLAIGDSIAVNGVCLTVTDISRNSFSANISEQSLKVTTLAQLKVGQKVNLERALTLAGRLGGHIMTGHIDTVIELKGKIAREDGYELIFSAPEKIRKYIIDKGAVGLDGISLTVAKVNLDGFSVMLIPHSTRFTTLGQKQIGDKINFEADIISKYLEGLLQGDAPTPTEKVFLNAGFLPIGITDN